MAHQCHNIPWQILTSNLKPVFHGPSSELANLFLLGKTAQTSELPYFVEAFVRNIQEHTRCERAKHPTHLDAPGDDEVLVTDAAAAKITPTILHWKQMTHSRMCDHGPEVSLHERKTPAFLRREHRDLAAGSLYFMHNLAMVKTLVLYNQMQPLLRVCAHTTSEWDAPAVRYVATRPRHDCIGWDAIYLTALDAYLVLNICHCFPDLWDPASGCTATHDYRNLYAYQAMLHFCTGGAEDDVARFPHRQFFGIGDDQFDCDYYAGSTEFLAGRVAFPQFLASHRSRAYTPSTTAVEMVRVMLVKRGLPLELAQEVLDLARYTPEGKLAARPHNPLHAQNARQLRDYLTYCWELVIRCGMLAEESGHGVNWTSIVIWRLSVLLSARGGKKLASYDRQSGVYAFI